MKDINIKIENLEDISYLESINYDRDIINVALTIGLKSIQMSQTTMTGNSYIEPLKKIIVENSIENSENIGKINDMLCDLLNIKNNSSRKGKLGESLAMNSLKKKYPDWKIENTTGTAHESDMFAYSNEYGKILYEIKTYSSNVPSKEIYKFKNDMVTTNCKYGIFISQTSGIVGKKLIDYSLDIAIQTKIFDQIFISTDSNKISKIVKKKNIQTPFFRSKKNSSDNALT